MNSTKDCAKTRRRGYGPVLLFLIPFVASCGTLRTEPLPPPPVPTALLQPTPIPTGEVIDNDDLLRFYMMTLEALTRCNIEKAVVSEKK